MNTRRRPTPRSVSYIALRSVSEREPWWAELLEIAGSSVTIILVAILFIIALPIVLAPQ